MASLRARLQLRPGSAASSPSHSHPSIFSPPHTSSSPPHPHSLSSDSAAYISSTYSARPSGSTKKPFQNLGLHSGAAFGNLGLVKFALDNGQPIDSIINGVQPIHAACCNNSNIPVVLFLIERGADVNARRYPRKYSGERIVGSQAVGTTGSTPLHFAAANGCMSIIETLLRHGAIADLADKYGSTPYSVATARGHPEVASVLHQHACMQRGLQVITPDADYRDSREKDAFASPRTSGDFSRRVSAIMAPTRSSTQQSETPLRSPSSVHGSSITSTATGALAAAAAAAIAASARFVGQRRVSLPSIVEAPSSPIMAAAPRQSCDLSRVPLLNEPLDPRKDSTGLGRRGSTHQQTAPPQVSGQGQDKKNNDKQERKLQGTLPSSVKSLEVSPSDLRRKSVDTAATHLSPPPTRPILRRASFDQLAAMRPIESKTRRDSDASNSETVVSSPSSCSTLASPIMQDGNDSRIRLDKIQGETSAMARSTSQPPLAPLESGSTRRTASASEPSVRRSFDIRLFASSRDHALSETEGEEGKGAKNGKDYKSYRRRSVQDPWTEGDHDERSSFLRSVKMTPSASDSSFHDSAVLDRNRFKHRTSLSGSATISGRFSRLWSHYSSKDTHEDENFHDKQDSTGSTGSLGSNGSDGIEFTDKDALGTKGRAGMMNRLSGMWTRR